MPRMTVLLNKSNILDFLFRNGGTCILSDSYGRDIDADLEYRDSFFLTNSFSSHPSSNSLKSMISPLPFPPTTTPPNNHLNPPPGTAGTGKSGSSGGRARTAGDQTPLTKTPMKLKSMLPNSFKQIRTIPKHQTRSGLRTRTGPRANIQHRKPLITHSR